LVLSNPSDQAEGWWEINGVLLIFDIPDPLTLFWNWTVIGKLG